MGHETQDYNFSRNKHPLVCDNIRIDKEHAFHIVFGALNLFFLNWGQLNNNTIGGTLSSNQGCNLIHGVVLVYKGTILSHHH